MKILIDKRILEIEQKQALYTGNINSYVVDIEFVNDIYDDYLVYIVFKNCNIKKKVLVQCNKVIIPSEVLKEPGDLIVGFFAVKNDNEKVIIYSSNIEMVSITNGGYDEEATYTEELTPNILEQYLQEMKEFYNESIKEYNDNALLETNKFNTNADNRKKEIDALALDVEEDKKAVEKIQEKVELSEQNAKESADNAKTSEQEVQNSANKALESENNITAIHEDINASKSHIDEQKEKVDKSVENVEKLVENATDQARISTEQADLSIEKAGQVSADKTVVENMMNEVSSMKTSVEQTKADAEQIKEETEQAKNETLEAKTEVENSLENERIESDKKYARAIETDEIVIDGAGRVELDENGYMKDVSIESNLPDITQKTRSGVNLYDVKDVKRKNDEVTVDENDFITMTDNNTGGNGTIYKNYCTKYSDRFEPNHEYFLVAEILEVEGSGRISFSSNHDSDKPQFITSEYRDFNTLSAGQKIIASIYTGENTWMGLRSFATFFTGQSGTIKYRISILKDEPTEENFEYEPYGASPSLDYPSEFQNVVKNVDIQVNGKNFCDISKFFDASGNAYAEDTYQRVKNGFVFENVNERTRIVSFKCNLKKGKKYIVNYNFENLGSEAAEVQCYLPEISQYVFKNKPFIAKEDVTLLGVYIDSKYINNSNIKIEVKEIQVEENEVATDFEVFKGYTEKVDLAEGQFLGNFKGYKNYIKDNKLLKSLVKVKLNGTEDWELKNVKEKTQVFFWNLQKKIVPNIGFCNYLKFNAPGDVEKYTPVEGGIYIAINKSIASTVEELKNLLSSLYNSGNAMTFIYAIPTPEKEELSTEIKSKINSLKVYNGINNIYSNCKIRFKANKNINNYIEKRLEEERNISDTKYAKTLKDSVTDKNFAQIYADNPKTENLVIEGEQLKQKVRQGYNLLTYPYVDTTKTKYGVTITDNGNGSITLNGTSTAKIDFGYQWTNNLPNDFYTFITYGLPDTCYTNYYQVGPEYGESVGNFNKTATTENINLGAQLVIPEGVTLSNITIYPMLVKGQYTRETIPAWEQYGASPSLDCPSEVELTRNQKITILKNNLSNFPTESTGAISGTSWCGVKFEVIDNCTSKISGKPTADEYRIGGKFDSTKVLIPIDHKKNYYIYNNLNLRMSVTLVQKDGTYRQYSINNKELLALTENDIGISSLRISVSANVEYKDTILRYIVCEDIKETDTILPEGQFNGAILEYSDEILADNKQEKVIKELVLTGEEDWSIAYPTIISEEFQSYMLNVENFVNAWITGEGMMSNCFLNVTGNIVFYKTKEGICSDDRGHLIICSKILNLEEFKTKIKELYDAGTPVKIYYAVENPKIVDLPKGTIPEIELMEDLNNISIDKGSFSFKYNKSLARAFEEEKENNANLQAQIDEIKALLSTTNTASLLAENLAKDNESEVI